MKRFNLLLSVSLIIIPLLLSCSHTNLLKDYSMYKTTVYFESEVSPNANNIVINDYSNPEFTDSSKSNTFLNTLAEVVSQLGESIVSNDLYKKLNKAVKPDSIIYDIRNDFQQNLIKLVKINPVTNIYDEYEYIVKIVLDKCDIIITSDDIYLEIKVITTITHIPSATVVWEYNSEYKKPLRNNKLDMNNSHSIVKDISQAYNALSLSEDEISQAVLIASYNVAKEIYETFREDYKESIKSLNSRQ